MKRLALTALVALALTPLADAGPLRNFLNRCHERRCGVCVVDAQPQQVQFVQARRCSNPNCRCVNCNCVDCACGPDNPEQLPKPSDAPPVAAKRYEMRTVCDGFRCRRVLVEIN